MEKQLESSSPNARVDSLEQDRRKRLFGYAVRGVASVLAVMVLLHLIPLGSAGAAVTIPDGAFESGLPQEQANCANSSVGLTPLNDLGTGTYQGFQGGLYSNGQNQPSAAYLQLGINNAAKITPRNQQGQAVTNGKIVLLSIGPSNASMEFTEFQREANTLANKNPRLVMVNGAQANQDADIVADPNSNFWTVVQQRLTQQQVTAQQVQAAWLKEAIANPTEPFPKYAQHLQLDLQTIVTNLRNKYPNLQIVYFAARTYGGYSTTTLNPEPYAYQSGFADKWTIEQNISTGGTTPWLAWGPYFWTDGIKPRSDGLVWTCADVRPDGIHPSIASGEKKTAGMLMTFFQNDPTAKGWFLK